MWMGSSTLSVLLLWTSGFKHICGFKNILVVRCPIPQLLLPNIEFLLEILLDKNKLVLICF